MTPEDFEETFERAWIDYKAERAAARARRTNAEPAGMTWGELKRRWADVPDDSAIMLHAGERAGWLVRVVFDEGSRCLDLHDRSSVQGE